MKDRIYKGRRIARFPINHGEVEDILNTFRKNPNHWIFVLKRQVPGWYMRDGKDPTKRLPYSSSSGYIYYVDGKDSTHEFTMIIEMRWVCHEGYPAPLCLSNYHININVLEKNFWEKPGDGITATLIPLYPRELYTVKIADNTPTAIKFFEQCWQSLATMIGYPKKLLTPQQKEEINERETRSVVESDSKIRYEDETRKT